MGESAAGDSEEVKTDRQGRIARMMQGTRTAADAKK